MGKLQELADGEGLTVDGMLEAGLDSGCCAGICTADGCNYTTDVEPDQDAGWCEECQAGTVKSALVLAGVI